MENFESMFQGIPGELLMVLAGGLVAFLTQVVKKIRDRWGYDIDPKVFAALIAVVGGIGYAALASVAPDNWMESVSKFGALAFSGAVAIYELYKSLVKKSIDSRAMSFADQEVELKDRSLLFALIEVERQARMLKIEFEPFSLAWLKTGKLTENDLLGHIHSLKTRVSQEVSNAGEVNPLNESGM